MKKNRFHILHTWMLIACFITGQYMVYAHQHASDVTPKKIAHYKPNTQPKQILTENCRLCDAMQHNTMALANTTYFAPVVVSSYIYKAVKYNFTSIALILSGGRSPPMA